MIPKLRPKKCKGCGEKFTPLRPLQVACSIACAQKVVSLNNEKRQRRALKEAKEKAKTRRDWIRETQIVVNRYIRLRDAGKPCISCGRYHDGAIHAGHYMPTSSHPELRFDERNIHLQCGPCNTHLSGNLVNYRISLINRLGLETVEWLEGPHEPKKYTIDELKSIKAEFSQKCRELSKK